MNNTVHNRIFRIARREVFRIATRPLYLFCMIIAPLFCYLFFTTLMWNGLPTDMPAGVVDLDNTATTRRSTGYCGYKQVFISLPPASYTVVRLP